MYVRNGLQHTRLLTYIFRHAEDPSGENYTERAEGLSVTLSAYIILYWNGLP